MKAGGLKRRVLLQGGSLALVLGVHQIARGASILAVRVWPAADYTRVTIESDVRLHSQQLVVGNPPRLAVDIEGIDLSSELRELVGKIKPGDPYINGLRVGQNAPKVVRIVFDLKQTVAPQVFSLAPINARQLSRVTHVPFATLLPSCDGDVYTLNGAQIFDDSRYTASDESAPKYQIVLRGANHNFYNAHWSEDDDAQKMAPLYCRAGKIETLRLSAADQRRNGAFMMESFLRYFVGDEFQFAPYWKGQAPVPPAGCPVGETSCDERVVLTIHQPADQRKLLQNFRNADASAKNASGRPTVFERFAKAVQCQTLQLNGPPLRRAACTDPVTQLAVERLFAEGEKYNPATYDAETLLIWSITDQAQLQWEAPGPVVNIDTGDLSAQGFDTLSMRVAVLAPIGQEVEIGLTDTQGRKATVKGSDFSDALYGIARKPDGSIPLVDAPADAIYAATGTTRPLLNMVAVPLKAFALHGVDLAHIQQVTLRFPKGSGSAAVTDVQLQRMN